MKTTTKIGAYDVVVRRGPRMVTMGDGREEEYVSAEIYGYGKLITNVQHLNCTTLCLPAGAVRGFDATPQEILIGILSDEHVYSGAPAFPDDHDTVLEMIE